MTRTRTMRMEGQEKTGAGAAAGGRLVAVDGRTLPLRGVGIRADAAGGLARVVLEQHFVNSYAEPLRVTYQVPLPPEGALAGYTVRVGDRRLVGEVERLTAARERFEGALLEGRSAGLVEQDRANLFTQEIGNIPAGAEVVADLLIDQPLRWRQDGAWEWRFPTVVAPRYLGGEGRVADASRLGVDVAEGLLPVDMRLALVIRDALADGGRPASPSHPIRLAGGPSGMEVALADEPGAGLDRDVVIHWPVAQPRVGLSLDTGRPPAGHVRGGAGAASGEGERARLRLGQGDQLLDALHRHGVMHNQHIRRHGNLRYRREILHRVIRQIVETGIDDDLRLDQQSQRVAIRRCFRDAVCCDIAGGASHVVDYDRLAPRLGEFLAEQARDGIYLTAGRETNDHADRLFGVSCLRGRTFHDQQRQ